MWGKGGWGVVSGNEAARNFDDAPEGSYSISQHLLSDGKYGGFHPRVKFLLPDQNATPVNRR